MYTVDASVWVNAFDQREPGHHVSRQFLDVVRGQAVPITVPNLAIKPLFFFPLGSGGGGPPPLFPPPP